MPSAPKPRKQDQLRREGERRLKRTPKQRAADKAMRDSSARLKAMQGNRFWEARSRHGRKPIFPEGPVGAEMLLEACVDYFNWCTDNPLYAEKAYMGKEGIEVHHEPRMRPFTLTGLQLFIDVGKDAWIDWRRRQDLSEVVAWAEATIYDQKFAGAAAGFLNASIISRDLGLADKTELKVPDPIRTESITREMTAQEAADFYARTREER